MQVALDGVHYIEEPFVTLTVKNDGITDEYGFVSCGKEDMRKVVVKHVEAGTGTQITESEVFYGYSVSMVQQFNIAAKEIDGYKVVKSPVINKDQDFVEAGRTYIFEYVKEEVEDEEVAGGWKQNSVGWWYDRGDGTYPAGCWEKISGEWYYFNAAGYRVTGWNQISGTWYYFDKEGVMFANEWVNKVYYMTASGAMAKGWLQIEGTWYWFDLEGAKVTGWKSIKGVWYYFDEHGKMASDEWVDDNYYVTASGAMKTGWLYARREWYYFQANGKKATSQWVGNYYLKADGTMAVSEWVDDHKYYVGADGCWVPNPR